MILKMDRHKAIPLAEEVLSRVGLKDRMRHRTTFVVVTHNEKLALQTSRILKMVDGQIAEEIMPAKRFDLYQQIILT